MNLSANFTLAEMTKSQTATRRGFTEQFDPPADVVANLRELCVHILQPLRDHVHAIVVNSGYRAPRTNKAVGGAATSQHLTGQAADIEGVNVSNAFLFQKIQELKLPFDQLIWEYGTKDEPNWVHVSYGPRHRRHILYIPKHLKK